MSERRNELKAVTMAEEMAAKLPAREMAQLTARWVESWGQINSHLVAMAQSSLRNSAAAAEELRQCQSPSDMVDTQIRIARQAYDDYLDEARQLSELVVKLSSEAIGSAANAANSAR